MGFSCSQAAPPGSAIAPPALCAFHRGCKANGRGSTCSWPDQSQSQPSGFPGLFPFSVRTEQLSIHPRRAGGSNHPVLDVALSKSLFLPFSPHSTQPLGWAPHTQHSHGCAAGLGEMIPLFTHTIMTPSGQTSTSTLTLPRCGCSPCTPSSSTSLNSPTAVPSSSSHNSPQKSTRLIRPHCGLQEQYAHGR